MDVGRAWRSIEDSLALLADGVGSTHIGVHSDSRFRGRGALLQGCSYEPEA